jgi:hypothetical protein
MHTAVRLCDCGHVFPVIAAKDEKIEKFIQVSKAIDIKKLIEANAHHKEYRSLFVLVEQVFNKAVRIFNNITPQRHIEIQKEIHELARLWCREKNRKFNAFHRDLVNNKLHTLCSSHTTQVSTPSTPTLSSFPPSWKESEPANGRT